MRMKVKIKQTRDYEAMLKKSYQQAKEGKTVKIDIKDLWK